MVMRTMILILFPESNCSAPEIGKSGHGQKLPALNSARSPDVTARAMQARVLLIVRRREQSTEGIRIIMAGTIVVNIPVTMNGTRAAATVALPCEAFGVGGGSCGASGR